MKIRTLIAVAALLLPQTAGAEIGPVGAEFQVNSFTVGSQYRPAVAAGADGAFVVGWASYQDGFDYGVFGQPYDSVGQAVGEEFQVNSYTAGYQRPLAVAAGADGAFVVAWMSFQQDGSSDEVFGQRYDSAGQAVGTEFQVNSYTASAQRFPAVAAGADGAFVVVWTSYQQDGSYGGVFGRRYDSAGQAVGTEFQVNTCTTSYQGGPAVAVGANGIFVVAWNSFALDGNGQDGSYDGVFGQRYDSAGQAVGTEFQINSYTLSAQGGPAVAAGADGAFVVAWTSYGGQDGSEGGVFWQRYDSVGHGVGTEFQVNRYTTGFQRFPAVAAGADGAFVMAWASYAQDGSGCGVFGRRYNSAGQALGTEFQVNSFTTNWQRFPAVAAGLDGAFVVAWESYDQDGSDFGVFAQRFGVLPPCAGDCDRDGTLSIDELITGVATALELLPIDDCPAFDADKSGEITIDELVAAVDAALHGCTG